MPTLLTWRANVTKIGRRLAFYVANSIWIMEGPGDLGTHPLLPARGSREANELPAGMVASTPRGAMSQPSSTRSRRVRYLDLPSGVSLPRLDPMPLALKLIDPVQTLLTRRIPVEAGAEVLSVAADQASAQAAGPDDTFNSAGV